MDREGPLAPPPVPEGGYTEIRKEEPSLFDQIFEEGRDVLRKRHPGLQGVQALTELSGAADVKDFVELTGSAAKNVAKGEYGEAFTDAMYGGAAGAAAFIPGIGGIGDVRRAVKDTSLFRQNPDAGAERTNIGMNKEEYELKQKEFREKEEEFLEKLEGLSRKTGYTQSEILSDLFTYKGYMDNFLDDDDFVEQVNRKYGVIDTTGFGDEEPEIYNLFKDQKVLYDYDEELRGKKPTTLRNLQSFYNPIESGIENLPYSKKGTIDGQQATAWLSTKTPGAGGKMWDFFGLQLDPKAVYSKEDLRQLYKNRNFDIVGYTEDNYNYIDMQRMPEDIYGKEVVYNEFVVDLVPRSNQATPQRAGTHYNAQTIAHSRGSIRKDKNGDEYFLVEEIQSDAAQRKDDPAGMPDSPLKSSKYQEPYNPRNTNLVSGAQQRTTQASLMQMIVYAKQKGVEKLVVPHPETIASVRGFEENSVEVPKGFYQTYETYLEKALENIKKDFKDNIEFHRDENGDMNIWIDEMNIDPKKTELRFAEGGLVPGMNEEVDPVSGNPVPPGAEPENVRDDIDAKLSEGEFVIPANVVKYIGVEKIMSMVKKAEEALEQLEEQGMTGKPAVEDDDDVELPFDESELEFGDEEELAFNEGGLVTGDQVGNLGLRRYQDRLGFIRYVPYTPETGETERPEVETTKELTDRNVERLNTDADRGSSRGSQDGETYDISKLSDEDLVKGYRQQRQITEFMNSPIGKVVSRFAANAVPGVGLVAALAQKPIQNFMEEELQRRGVGYQDADTEAFDDDYYGQQIGNTGQTMGDRFAGQRTVRGSTGAMATEGPSPSSFRGSLPDLSTRSSVGSGGGPSSGRSAPSERDYGGSAASGGFGKTDADRDFGSRGGSNSSGSSSSGSGSSSGRDGGGDSSRGAPGSRDR